MDSLLARPDIDGEVRREIRELRLTITDALAQVRRELFSLRDSSGPSLKSQLQRLYVEHAVGFGGSCELDDLSLSDEDERAILLIARELLRNAAHHSHGGSIWLSLSTSATDLILSVRDDGDGGAQMKSGRFGLVGISEMVAERQGSLKILGNHGSSITISLPLLPHESSNC